MTAEVHGGRLSLASETRAELRGLARLVAEDPDQRDGVMEVVTLLAADVSAVDHLFDCLTEAVAEQESLHNDPRSYLEARDFPLRSVDRIADSLASNVEGLLDQLTAGAGGVVTPTTSAQSPTGSKMRNPAVAGGVLAVVGYIATIVGANYAIHHLGQPGPVPAAPHTLPVWPGLAAPSGVYFVALALVLRNIVQRQLGRRVAVAAILIGAAISWYVADPALAKASAAAFLLSEALDMAVYTRLRRHGQIRAVLPASLAGAALDSWLFLRIAFHSESFWTARMLGKTWGVLAAAVILAGVPVVTARLPRTAEVVPA